MRLTRDQVETMSQKIIRGLIREEVITADRPEAANPQGTLTAEKEKEALEAWREKQ